MILGVPPQAPQSLAEWLEQATWYLAPSAQARIRAEIESHYAQAVQAYLQNGSTEFTAQTAALADLGAPSAAFKRFCREHFNQGDIACVNHLLESDRSTRLLGMASLLLFTNLVFADSQSTHQPLRFLATIMLVQALAFIPGKICARVLAGQKMTKAIVRRLIAIHFLIFHLNLGLYLVVAYGLCQPDRDSLLGVLMLPYLSCPAGIFPMLHLWKKLRSASDEDMPNHTSTAT